jgi:hypothetical protein
MGCCASKAAKITAIPKSNVSPSKRAIGITSIEDFRMESNPNIKYEDIRKIDSKPKD